MKRGSVPFFEFAFTDFKVSNLTTRRQVIKSLEERSNVMGIVMW